MNTFSPGFFAAPLTFALALLPIAGCTASASPPPSTPPDATAHAPGAPPPSTAPAAPTAEVPPAPGTRTPVAEGEMCGGIAGFQCQAGLYCAYAPESRCGAADASGTCSARPEVCTEEYAPVCGCDDKTYGNACAAAREGISVSRSGECPTETPPGATAPPGTGTGVGSGSANGNALTEGKLCGTRGVRGECGEGLYCNYRRNCGSDDSGGTCAKKTPMCTRIYQPVCGCDNKTYGNACTAAAAGVSVAKAGECAP